MTQDVADAGAQRDNRALVAFKDAVAYTESLIGPPRLEPLKTRAQMREAGERRLGKVRRLLELLGHPERHGAFLHVGGTSGKGSTATMVASMLQAAGHRVGLHTGPYLQSPVEKLLVDGRPITPDGFVALIDMCRPAIKQMATEPCGVPTYIELWAVLPLLHFAQETVRYAVVEVGVGGRFDGTNVITPVVSLITTVGHDHTQSLGHHLTDIAWHKAGIMKEGVPAVTGVRQPEALAVLEAEAGALGVPLRVVRPQTDYDLTVADGGGTAFTYRDPWGHRHGYRTGMLGAHQAGNAALALAALDAATITVPIHARERGLVSARIPGRLEVVQRQPLVVLDGAHNGEKSAVLAAALRDLFPYDRLILVLAVLQGKALPALLAPLMPLAHHVVATAYDLPGKPGLPAAELARAVEEYGVPVCVDPNAMSAVQYAIAMASPRDVVCITGSLYLVGQARDVWVHAAQSPG